jgi:hypothetical protein
MSKSFIGSVIAATLIGLVGSITLTNTAHATSWPTSTPCGSSGWSLIASAGTLVTYRSGSTFCALQYNPFPGVLKGLSVSIRNSAGVGQTNSGNFYQYAGPVKLSLPYARCATVSGAVWTPGAQVGAANSYLVCND